MTKAFDASDLNELKGSYSNLDTMRTVSGGKVYQLKGVKARNAVVLEQNGRYYVYVRPQPYREGREKAYGTRGLRDKLDPNGRFEGYDGDHVASIGIEGSKHGQGYVLFAYVPSHVNQTHGGSTERGPIPVREFSHAASPGLPGVSDARAAPLTQESVDKLRGISPKGKGHRAISDAYLDNLLSADLRQIERSLMQDETGRKSIAKQLGKEVEPSKAEGRAATPGETSIKQPLGQLTFAEKLRQARDKKTPRRKTRTK